MFSEAFGVIVVVAMVLAIVSSCYQYRYWFHLSVSRYQMLSKYCSVKVSVLVLRCQVLSSQSLKVSFGQDFVVSGCRDAL
jgi:hypothetical protein